MGEFVVVPKSAIDALEEYLLGAGPAEHYKEAWDVVNASAPKQEAEPVGFEYSRDYGALWDFICSGGKALAFVDYRFLDEPKDVKPWRDPVQVQRIAPYQIKFAARGISYGDIYPFEQSKWPDEKELFFKACSNINLEWAKPVTAGHPPAPKQHAPVQFKLIGTPEPADLWGYCEMLTDIPSVDEALCAFVEDPTGDNAIAIVREIVGLTMQKEQPAPVRTCDRLPTEADADCHGQVWACYKGDWRLLYWYSAVTGGTAYSHWQPTGLRKPADPED